MSKVIANCPECGFGLGFADVAIIGENMIVNGYDSIAECPSCHVQWEWAKPGEIAIKQDDEAEDDDYVTFGSRRPKIERQCACGCREIFRTNHKDQYYKNPTHWKRGQRKGISVDPDKRPKSKMS